MSDFLAKFGSIQNHINERNNYESQLRSALSDLDKHIKDFLKRSELQASVNIDLGEDNDFIYYGILSIDYDGLSLYIRSSRDDEEDQMRGFQDDEKTYHPIKLEKWSFDTLLRIENGNLIEKLFEQLETRVKQEKETIASFANKVNILASRPATTLTPILTKVARNVGFTKVIEEWDEAYKSIEGDPANATLKAGTLLETTLKHFIETKTGTVDETSTLKQLIDKLREHMKTVYTSPQDKRLLELLEATFNLSQKIGNIRNEISSAHGKSTTQRVATVEEARLDVTLAGAVCVYLLSLA